MSRSPSPMPWWRVSWVLPLLLAACASLPTRPPLLADQQRDFLQELAAFSFTGRAVMEGHDANPYIEWQQRRGVAKVRLTGPARVGGIRVEYSAERLRIETGSAVKRDDEAEHLLKTELGFVPPFESLRYWVLGLPAPGSPSVPVLDAGGQLQQMEQLGWVITYRRHVDVETAAGSLRLPALLTASREGLGLRLVIDRWLIK
jgi:outer membrane lipoprotein LolB